MIRLEKLTKKYGITDALCSVELSIQDGEFVVITGASGSGKSTLLNVMSGLERPDSGSVFYGDTNISALNEKNLTSFRKENVGFVFQQYYLLPNMNGENNIKMGAELSGNKSREKIGEILEAVGLSDKRKKYPSELSGGEQQRVSIARAIAKEPRVLFLDEPTGALDEQTGRQVLDFIIKLQRERSFTMIMITHNLNIAETANIVVKMNSGKIVDIFNNAAPKSAYEIGW